MAKGTTIRMWRRSLVVLVLLVFVAFALLICRLFGLQVFQAEFLQKMAFTQQLLDTKIEAQRGTIYDRNGKPLAVSATVWNVVLEPSYIKSDEIREVICQGLHEILGIDKEKLMNLAKKKSCYTIVKKGIEADIKDKIIKFKVDNNITAGLRLIEGKKRYYPNGDFLSVVLGFVGTDSQGLAGLEAFYEKTLKGTPGRLVTAKNAIGTEMPFDYERMIDPQEGLSLRLCIDESTQKIIEKHLEEGIINNKIINRACAIVMDVNNGEILGLAVKGGFNPNEPFKIADSQKEKAWSEMPDGPEKSKEKVKLINEQWRNKAISDVNSPGSVFKAFTASLGFELDIINEKTPFHCNGSIKPIPGAQTIHCWRRKGHGAQTFDKAFCNSCNPAFVMTGMKCGAENFFKNYKAFGFHEKTGIDLPGEAPDLFFSKDGSMAPMDLVVGSFGQNFGVTPIQMITAFSAIANGGKVVQPHIVKEIIDSDGNIVKKIETKIKRTAISKKTADRVTSLLKENAISGAAKNAYVPGFRVAGKTGTSEKKGHSRPGRKDYISSFCGFAPADAPKVAMFVMYDTPDGANYYGGVVAAPTFGKAMPEILEHMGVEKIYTEEELKKIDSVAPKLVGKKTQDAKATVISQGFSPTIIGEGEKVLSQIPAEGEKIPKGGKIVIYTVKKTKTIKVPNLLNLTMYEANRVATNANLNFKISGTPKAGENVASSIQSIEEGTEVPIGTVITVTFIHKDGAT